MKITYKNLKNYLPNQATNNAKPILYAINNSYCDYVQLFTFDNIKAVAKCIHCNDKKYKYISLYELQNKYNILLDNISLYLEFMTDKHINYKDDDLPF